MACLFFRCCRRTIHQSAKLNVYNRINKYQNKTKLFQLIDSRNLMSMNMTLCQWIFRSCFFFVFFFLPETLYYQWTTDFLWNFNKNEPCAAKPCLVRSLLLPYQKGVGRRGHANISFTMTSTMHINL